jgi:hypothetical protein
MYSISTVDTVDTARTLFVNTVVFWLINTFYDFVLNKHNRDDSPQSYSLFCILGCGDISWRGCYLHGQLFFYFSYSFDTVPNLNNSEVVHVHAMGA